MLKLRFYVLYLFRPDSGLFTLAEHWTQTASYVLINHIWIFWINTFFHVWGQRKCETLVFSGKCLRLFYWVHSCQCYVPLARHYVTDTVIGTISLWGVSSWKGDTCWGQCRSVRYHYHRQTSRTSCVAVKFITHHNTNFFIWLNVEMLDEFKHWAEGRPQLLDLLGHICFLLSGLILLDVEI